MELPAALRTAIEAELEGTPLAALKQAATRLSQRYRAETLDGRAHLSDEMAARAYLAARMPATFAAIASAFEALRDAAPAFAPKTLLDVGAGPGTALWAAADAFSELQAATLLEASAPIRIAGERLARGAFTFPVAYVSGDAAQSLRRAAPSDLVTLAYVLDELPAPARLALVDQLWSLTSGVLLLVEPGTPAGWRRILEMRDRLLGQGATILAPCPHHEVCPIHEPDWCHFARRLPRSRMHRLVKDGEAPFEDEKFAYLAAARFEAGTRRPRILSRPDAGSGKVALKLCQPDGTARQTLLTKRDGDAFRAARRADWGDAL